MTSINNRLLSLLIVSLVVASAVTMPLSPLGGEGGAVGSADAQTVEEDVCSIDDFLGFDTNCQAAYDSTVSDTDNLGAYQTGLSKIAGADSYRAVFNNYAEDTEDIAWLIAEREIYESIEAGESKALAQSQAQTAIQEYFQTKKLNYLDFWNQYATAADNIDQAASYSILRDNTPEGTTGSIHFEGVGDTRSFTFNKINESIDVKRIISDDGDGDGPWHWDPIDGKQDDGWNAYSGTYQLNLYPPNPEDGATTPYIYETQWEGYQTMEQKETEVINQMETYTDNTYSQFETGVLNATDALSQVNQLNNLLTNVSVANGTFSEVTSYLAATGMSSPDLSNTSYMTIEHQPYTNGEKTELAGYNQTLEGLLMTSAQPPGGSWNTSVRYDTENLDGSVSVALVEGGYKSLDGVFQIKEVRNEQGDLVTDVEIETENRDYAVSNTTQLNERTQRLQEQINELQDLRDSSDTDGAAFNFDFGGWDGFNFGPDLPVPTIWVIGGLAALLLLTRS